jgi:hypothetical protein
MLCIQGRYWDFGKHTKNGSDNVAQLIIREFENEK